MPILFEIKRQHAIEFELDNVRVVTVGSVPAYEGETTVIPKADAATVLPTAGKRMREDITVTKIPYYEVSNPLGDTVYIAEEV